MAILHKKSVKQEIIIPLFGDEAYLITDCPVFRIYSIFLPQTGFLNYVKIWCFPVKGHIFER
jgi:hypothetical protein